MMNETQTKPAQGVYRFEVAQADSGHRLDLYLASQTEGFSRGYARRLIDIGGVHVDGRRTRKCGLTVSAGQKIEVFVDGLPLEPFALEPAHILYEDKFLIAINKPAGVVTQPTPARYRGSLYDALQRYLSVGKGPTFRAGIGMVQRLDRDTSGVLIFSIHPKAHKPLTRMILDRCVTKIYRVMVCGEVDEPSGVITSQLARKRANNRTVSVSRGGRFAETRYSLVASWGLASLLDVELITGRTHQIRAHFSEIGHPLLGDGDYGGPVAVEGRAVPRQMLHSRVLKLSHPVTGEPLCVEAPVPGDFQTLADFLAARHP